MDDMTIDETFVTDREYRGWKRALILLGLMGTDLALLALAVIGLVVVARWW